MKKERLAAYHAAVLDDVGTKVDAARLEGIEASWRLKTSNDNYQVGFILEEPLTDTGAIECLQKAIAAAGLCDAGALGLTNTMNQAGESIACTFRRLASNPRQPKVRVRG